MDKKTLTLNGLKVQIINSKSVTIVDKMSNCTSNEAAQICTYLIDEGFLKENKEITCEIVQF